MRWSLLLLPSIFAGSLTAIENEIVKGWEKEAFESGNSSTYSNLGFAYTKEDMAKSLLFHSVAVEDPENIVSRLVLGYRYMYGVGVEKSCMTSVTMYESIAYNTVSEWLKKRIPRSRTQNLLPYLNPDYERIINSLNGFSTLTSQDDVVTYYEFASQRGDHSATIFLAQLYYYGTQGQAQDFKKALPYVRKAADEHLGTGLGMLGEMYYLGLGGLVQSDVMALKYFKEGAKAGNVIALNGMGLLSLRSDLTALKSDITEALSYFLKAAEKDYPEAQYNAGKVFARKYLIIDLMKLYFQTLPVELNHPKKASHYMVIAARHSYIPAMLEVAEMYMKGDGVLKSCQIAASFYKPVAEKNPRVVEMFKKATNTFHRAEAEDNLNLFQSAEEQFRKLAEMGLEPAQNNLAYIYESRGKNGNTNETLLWYHRSSYQGNVLAKIKVGDLFYYGIFGADKNLLDAAKFYQAADMENNAQATFNLGLMHLFGIGLDRDLHLAKRFFDKTLIHQPNAFLAVYMCHSVIYYQWYLLDTGYAFAIMIILILANLCYPSNRRPRADPQ